MDEFVGNVAVITGGAGGLGLAMARRFIDAGMRVVVADIELAALTSSVSALGDQAFGVVCDVADADSVESLRAAAIERFGRVDVVCLNAGVAAIGSTIETDIESWRWVFDVNVLGVVHGIHAFVPSMVTAGTGHVVITASSSGFSTTWGLSAYTASKHAVVGIAATLDLELRGSGVGLSILCPGALRTGIFESDRNRPQDRPGSTYTVSEAMLSGYRRAVEAGADPSIAAEAVVGAIIDKRLWVFPSPEIGSTITDRFDEVRAALVDQGGA